MEVICLEDEAFYKLVKTVVKRIRPAEGKKEDKWIFGERVMVMLNIKAKSALQKLRDKGKIRFSQPERNIICLSAFSDLMTRITFIHHRITGEKCFIIFSFLFFGLTQSYAQTSEKGKGITV